MNVDGFVDNAFEPLNWSELDEVKQADAVIPGLLNVGESGSLVGQAESGKSLLMLEVAVALALGNPVLGQAALEPMTVMYVDMENPPAELAQRVRSLGHLPADLAGSNLHYFSFPDLPALDTATGGRRLALGAEKYNPSLIVLDTISRMVGGKEDSADTWRDFYNFTMVPLRRQNRAVLRIDHQGHDATKGARGSSAKRDDVDVAWIMRRKGNEVTLIRDKGRGLSYPEQHKLVRHTSPTCHLPTVTGGKIDECCAALDRLDVPRLATRDDAADELRSNGYRFSNDVIGAALKKRRPSPSGPEAGGADA